MGTAENENCDYGVNKNQVRVGNGMPHEVNIIFFVCDEMTK